MLFFKVWLKRTPHIGCRHAASLSIDNLTLSHRNIVVNERKICFSCLFTDKFFNKFATFSLLSLLCIKRFSLKVNRLLLMEFHLEMLFQWQSFADGWRKGKVLTFTSNYTFMCVRVCVSKRYIFGFYHKSKQDRKFERYSFTYSLIHSLIYSYLTLFLYHNVISSSNRLLFPEEKPID